MSENPAPDTPTGEAPTEDRRRWMGVLAKAAPEEIAAVWSGLSPVPAYDLLRRPETGLVMVRGRIGGDGAPFNLGEMTVTRCSIRLAGSLAGDLVGHAWVAGRRHDHAERAAVLDALMQDPARRPAVEPAIARMASRQAAHRAEDARKAAATRVDFFTMVRGEN
ncbi:phosphonate C-P lyase system protein PhnG [Azospirillum canadense]|uniref:phosphonate C-P lyase system protein PhnG n=1 Tax=Azospirillum canadense TaxID=403962 RepID=UPI002225D673|nr:phosphonate C-P lyase system protein PhnG [Azospirillum canadense]MCW2239974.1 alpha-D-ribose 1-methylphosphonate 5-triphosphate synthase subunit PhnG [Azospirillum canadense]